MARADVIREAFQRYHRREITLAQLFAVIADWRPPNSGQRPRRH